ncbi:hypothetical protein OUZ56_021968 [Daphnia magna]|uniref:Uncharacterized protein n=1 Tax=Daphnia magna TaxID=35525 RepID=A0ABR0AV34_9CRUS|nr:hypothetical protein OUZ56_021968 [Daphnia magna]
MSRSNYPGVVGTKCTQIQLFRFSSKDETNDSVFSNALHRQSEEFAETRNRTTEWARFQPKRNKK